MIVNRKLSISVTLEIRKYFSYDAICQEKETLENRTARIESILLLYIVAFDPRRIGGEVSVRS